MKKLLLAVMLLAGMTSFAQEGKIAASQRGEKMTADQRSELRVKEMTLQLDLNASQQKEIAAILDEQAAKRDAAIAERRANQQNKKELSADEKFKLKSKMLDERIAFKAKMKNILNKAQFEKWEESQPTKRGKVAHTGKERKVKRTEAGATKK